MNAASAQTVAEVMSTDLLTLKLTDTLRLADDMLNLAQVRHFPVLDGDTIAGLVDQDDLLMLQWLLWCDIHKTRREALGSVIVKDIMKPAITISPDLEIRAAAEIMVEKGVEALLVVNAETLVGLVTRTDLLRQLAKR